MLLAILVAALGAAAPASGAGALKAPTGGRGATWAVVPTTTGTYAVTLAYTKKRPVLRSFKVTPAGFTAGPALAIAPDDGLYSTVGEDGSGPCVGANVKRSPYVACLQGGAWVERRFTGAARTRYLLDVNRYGSTTYAYLIEGDLGVFDGKHPERFKLAASVVRWDGAAWVTVVPKYEFSLAQLSSPVPCVPLAAPVCAPLLTVGKAGAERFTVRKLGADAWVPDGRSVAMRKNDSTLGPLTAFGDRLAIPVFASTPKVSSLVVLTDSTAPRRIRVATLVGSYAGAWLNSVAGTAWIGWTDFFYFDKKETRGLVVGRAAPLDLLAGTAGPATEVYAEAFSNIPSDVHVEDVDGAPYGAYVEHGKSQDSLVLQPLALP